VKKIFVDSDIILDLLAKREPFYLDSAKLFTLIEQKKIKAFTSPLIFANVHYILRKLSSNEIARRSLSKLKTFLTILPIDERIIELALASNFKDFEDAIQYYTAVGNNIEAIITRNKLDYKKSKIIVVTAEEYILMQSTV